MEGPRNPGLIPGRFTYRFQNYTGGVDPVIVAKANTQRVALIFQEKASDAPIAASPFDPSVFSILVRPTDPPLVLKYRDFGDLVMSEWILAGGTTSFLTVVEILLNVGGC